jgi:hypothetical protein
MILFPRKEYLKILNIFRITEERTIISAVPIAKRNLMLWKRVLENRGSIYSQSMKLEALMSVKQRMNSIFHS